MSLAGELARLATETGSRIRRGKVQSTTGTKVTVRIAGVDSQPLARLASYSPAVNDEVAVLVDDGAALVLGKIA